MIDMTEARTALRQRPDSFMLRENSRGGRGKKKSKEKKKKQKKKKKKGVCEKKKLGEVGKGGGGKRPWKDGETKG